jgi:hypothetical protein
MVTRMQAHACQLGVVIELGARVDRLPDPPVIVATPLESARRLLGDDTLRWDSGRTVLLDLGLRRGLPGRRHGSPLRACSARWRSTARWPPAAAPYG